MLHLIRRARTADLRVQIAIGVILIAIGVGLPFISAGFTIQLFALTFPLVILALSADMMWGEGRLVSFGQGLFFAAGGYVGGLILIGAPYDVSGSALSFLSEDTEKPLFNRVLLQLHDFAIAGIPIPAIILPAIVCGAVGLVVGMIVFRVASPEVYFPLVTLGLGVVGGLWFNDLAPIGASNGLGGIPQFTSQFGDPKDPMYGYFFNIFFVIVAFVGWAWFRRSRRGSTWRGTGDNAVRLEALGYSVRRQRVLAFGASAALAGLAGALYASTAGFMGPSLAGVAFSAEVLIWVAVGGSGRVLGPLVGTIVVRWGQQLLSSNLGLEQSWQLFMGLALIIVVVVAPGGLLGISADPIRRRLLGRRGEGDGPGGPTLVLAVDSAGLKRSDGPSRPAEEEPR